MEALHNVEVNCCSAYSQQRPCSMQCLINSCFTKLFWGEIQCSQFSVTRSQVRMRSRRVKFGVIIFTLSYWSLEVQHGTSWQRTLWGSEKIIVALHKDGVGYKKIAKTLKLSCSTVVKTIQRFNRTGSTKKLTKKLSAPEWDQISHTASNWSAWLSSQKEASSKDDAQVSSQTVCWRQAD